MKPVVKKKHFEASVMREKPRNLPFFQFFPSRRFVRHGKVLEHLSWQLESDRPGSKQTAYQIVVSSPEEPAGIFWDSGKVLSDQSITATAA
jgi:hypothetical protein